MKNLVMIVMVLFVAFGTTQAEQIKLPAGKYLVLMNDADGENTEAKIPIQISKEGVLSMFFAKARKPMPLARVKSVEDGTFNLEFSPLFDAGLSGDYKLKHLPQNHFQLTSSKGKMLFSPFVEDEVAMNNQTRKEIEGKWLMRNENEEIEFDFYLPNKLHIRKYKKYEEKASDVFWVSQTNGEDITVSATLFFDVFAGTLKKVRVEKGYLYFTYKGKEYKMKKIEKVRN